MAITSGAITNRKATAADFAACQEIARRSGAYRDSLEPFLPQVWEELATEKTLMLRVVEEREGERVRILGFRCSHFLDQNMARALPGWNEPNVVRELYRRHTSDKSAILNREGVGRANAGKGLTFFAYSIHLAAAVEPSRVAGYGYNVSTAFWEMIQGYNLNEAFVENYSGAAREYMEAGGYRIIADYPDCYRPEFPREDRLFLVHLARDEARFLPGKLAPALIFPPFNAPRLGLRPKEQEMLQYALEDDTDAYLAAQCDCARITIKKRWEVIYDRVDRADASISGGETNGSRRHRLLKYLRERPEELRPYLPKIRD